MMSVVLCANDVLNNGVDRIGCYLVPYYTSAPAHSFAYPKLIELTLCDLVYLEYPMLEHCGSVPNNNML